MGADELELIIPDWPAPEAVSACTTTRGGGFSRGPWSQLNLADHVGDDATAVSRNRELLGQRLALRSEPVWLQQVHGCDVCKAEDAENHPVSDASISSNPGVVCAVLTADCLPILLCDESGTHVGAIHAGWRGLAAGVIERTIEALPVSAGKILAWMGPAIGPDMFEVGDDVFEVFVRHDRQARNAFKKHGDKWLCDIYLLAKQRLTNVGVDKIYGGGLCTCSDHSRFYSYRRDGVTGRMASLIWINSPSG